MESRSLGITAESKLEAALTYAGRGWAIFPLRGKVPAISKAKGGSGFLDATTNESQIRAWWSEHPNADIGIATQASGLLVLDVDERNGGDVSLAALETKYGALSQTPECITGSGGRHIYFKAPEPDQVQRKSAALGEGLDLPPYVVAPPSVHPATGRSYEWDGALHPDDIAKAAAPPWLIDVAQSSLTKKSNRFDDESLILEGNRNSTLTSLGGSMIRAGISASGIRAALLAENAMRCSPPLSESEVLRIAVSLSNYTSNITYDLYKRSSEVRLYSTSAEELREHGSLEESLRFLPFLGEDGLMVAGLSHLLSGYPKVGKTELLTRLALEWVAQGHRVSYYSEEPRSIWQSRLASITSDLSRLHLVFSMGYSAQSLLDHMRASESDVVIIDGIRLLGIEDENSNSQINIAITPFMVAARDLDQTLIFSHHTRKGSGENGEAAAGGHAFLGAVDVGLELKRDSHHSNRRTIRGWARVISIPTTIYEKDGETFRSLGDPEGFALEVVEGRINEALDEVWQSTKEVRDSLGEPSPSTDQVSRALNSLSNDGLVERDPPLALGAQPGKTYRWRIAITRQIAVR